MYLTIFLKGLDFQPFLHIEIDLTDCLNAVSLLYLFCAHK